ncbi:MAG TPA: ABC transporter substrate-binding protein [Acidimicrobiales bacterium]|nr:ABC transporter substrate-binding protein [Acidimicrobiales bacterium]
MSKVPPTGRRWRFAVALVLASLLFAAACGDDSGDGGGSAGGGGGGESATLRLGYFPNVTHAPAVAGVQEGIFDEATADVATIEYSTFDSGTEAGEALLADGIDATFIGPNPAINAYAQTEGEAVRLVAGTTSGGAALVVSEDIQSPEDLQGRTLATPSLGNTQDVALRAWLTEEGYEIDDAGGGDVPIVNLDNSDTLTSFQEGTIDGAWVPEPWATRLVQEGGGTVLVDEADLWENGEFVTTHLLVRTDYLEENPDVIRALLTGLADAEEFVNGDAAAAQASVNAGIESVTGEALPEAVISASWENLTFTLDPIASSLEESKNDAVEVGLLEDVDLEGIYDLTLLNEVLEERGEDPIEA